MNFAFTDEQVLLHGAVRDVLEHEGASCWHALCELGAPGVLVPEEHGGLGLGDVEMVGILEAAGFAALDDPLAESAAIAAPLLLAVGRTEWLPRIATGELIVSVGSVTQPALTAGSVVTRHVPAVGTAHAFVLGWEVPDSGCQVHAAEASGVEVAVVPHLDAARGAGDVEWTPWPHTLLGGDQLGALLADRGALAAAAQLIGLADRMITLGAAYALDRSQFGRPIGSYQAVKHLLADARVRLEFARPAVYRAAWSMSSSHPDRAEHISMAKALASDAAELAARASLQVHGAIGYTEECALNRFLKRTWSLAASWGTAVEHRGRVLDAAVRRPD